MQSLSLHEVLTREVQELKQQSLLRRIKTLETPQGTHIVLDERPLLNFASNDYLGLANHPKLIEAASSALHSHGAGAGASRLLGGSSLHYNALETELASWKKAQACLIYPSGYMAALGTIPHLVRRGDQILIDRLAHACLLDATKSSPAKWQVFRHNDLNHLDHLLQKIRTSESSLAPQRILIVTESVFSMDGDTAPLPELVNLKNRYGAWLFVDEAHGTGLFGPSGAGLAEHYGLSDQIEIQMGTLGKALGSSGGFIAGDHSLIQFLVNRSRTLIFTTGLSASPLAAARAAVDLARSLEGHQRRETLRQRIRQWHTSQGTSDFKEIDTSPHTAICPIPVGNEELSLQWAEFFWNKGIYLPAVRYPSVGKGKARLRLTLSANHTQEELERVITGVRELNLPSANPLDKREGK